MSSKSKKSKLFNTLNSLTISQKRDLEKFFTMPSAGLTSGDRVLFERLLSALKKNKELDEAEFWTNALAQKDIANKNRIKSRLFKAIENYVCLLEIKNDRAIKSHLLSSFYFRKNLMQNLMSTLNKGIRLISPLTENNLNNKIISYWLHEKIVRIKKDVRKDDTHIIDMEQELTDFYVLNKMRIICEKVNRLKIINTGEKPNTYSKEIEELRLKSNSIYADIYYYLFKLTSETKSVYFHKLEKLSDKNLDNLNTEIFKEVYAFLMNYCIGKINKGELTFAEHYFNYVKILEAKGLILDSGIIGIGRFKNIMIVCQIMDNPDWSSDFIHKYAPYLQETKLIKRKDFLALNLAIIKLWQKDFDKCAEYIHAFRSSAMYHKDVYYKITCDKLLLKVHYELGESEMMVHNIKVLRNYIKSRKNILEQKKVPNIKFLNFLEKIDREKAIKLEKIKGKIPISDYLWLEKTAKKG